jgi:hypothetical protein
MESLNKGEKGKQIKYFSFDMYKKDVQLSQFDNLIGLSPQ